MEDLVDDQFEMGDLVKRCEIRTWERREKEIGGDK